MRAAAWTAAAGASVVMVCAACTAHAQCNGDEPARASRASRALLELARSVFVEAVRACERVPGVVDMEELSEPEREPPAGFCDDQVASERWRALTEELLDASTLGAGDAAIELEQPGAAPAASVDAYRAAKRAVDAWRSCDAKPLQFTDLRLSSHCDNNAQLAAAWLGVALRAIQTARTNEAWRTWLRALARHALEQSAVPHAEVRLGRRDVEYDDVGSLMMSASTRPLGTTLRSVLQAEDIAVDCADSERLASTLRRTTGRVRFPDSPVTIAGHATMQPVGPRELELGDYSTTLTLEAGGVDVWIEVMAAAFRGTRVNEIDERRVIYWRDLDPRGDRSQWLVWTDGLSPTPVCATWLGLETPSLRIEVAKLLSTTQADFTFPWLTVFSALAIIAVAIIKLRRRRAISTPAA